MSGVGTSRGVGIVRNAADTPVTIVGCGGIGSWVGIALARMGWGRVDLHDPDTVESVNIGPQAFRLGMVGSEKPTALRGMMLEALPAGVDAGGVLYSIHCRAVRANTRLNTPIVVSAVDSLKARSTILKACQASGVRWLVDGRMGGQSAAVYVCDLTDPVDLARYERTLQGEPTQLPCTHKATAFCGLIVGGLVAHRVVRCALGEPVNRYVQLDLGEDGCTWGVRPGGET